ncbi:hypothetical protein P0E52_00185 [Enterococcus faecalis]|uniref:hypothetical protein n=1 Tax=Enterococcus TaxID=1350 RepID=UPI00053BDF3F|nr:hypothetical protein [Enterococcus faecalis]EHQ8839925.1 hypothetical protein [Enterococcus faecalis]KII54384.1 hypothetical protein QR19_03845 [Enterococcus faecalis]MDN3112424.1 hypothetical protein [Enterococcus faecalis]HBI2038614.1 hypothetical protein [Enterococcus faecalis]HBI2080487.1 hypothetical protein [Enterococcus faecalis]
MEAINYIGYHGTDESILNEINKRGFKTDCVTNRLPCDLGPGIYMYISRPEFSVNEPKENAYKFVKNIKYFYKNPIVLEINARFENKNTLLDMNDPINQKFFLEFKQKNLSKIEKIYKELNDNRTKKRGKIDGLVLDLMIRNTKAPIDAVIMDSYTPFDFKGYRQSNIPNGRELCLRNSKNIVSYSTIQC